MEALLKTTVAPVVPLPSVIPTDEYVYQKAGDVGNRALWVVFVIMLISSIAFYAMAFRVPVQKRLFHILTAFITTFAALSYFAMAIGDGVSLHEIKTKKTKDPETFKYVEREVYWARYVDWTVTTPLLLLDLAILAGLAGANILVAIVADLIMIVTGLFAAFKAEEGPKWGWYAIACIAYLVVVYQLGVNGRHVVQGKDTKTAAFFSSIAGFTFVLWTIYPIIWGIADGSRNIDVNSEIIAYAVLDVLAKPIFGFWLLFTHDSMSNSASLEGFWANGMGKDGTIRVGEDEDGA